MISTPQEKIYASYIDIRLPEFQCLQITVETGVLTENKLPFLQEKELRNSACCSCNAAAFQMYKSHAYLYKGYVLHAITEHVANSSNPDQTSIADFSVPTVQKEPSVHAHMGGPKLGVSLANRYDAPPPNSS